MSEERFHRQELLFGKEGQALLETADVAIVGVGGLGSHVAQQLAYLGVRSFRLIDPDRVEMSNLNRLVGAVESDGIEARPKVDVIERTIRTIQPRAAIRKFAMKLVSADGFAAVQGATWVFGCLDNDAARLILNELCQAYELPYFDLATEIDPSTGAFGGRVVYASGAVCMHCKGLLDQASLQRAFATEGEKAEEERIYGIERGTLGGSGPAVVSLNGVLASVAVTEFLVEVTGIRSAHRFLEYRGGRLFGDSSGPNFACYYCKEVRGKRKDANLERWISG